MRHSAKYVSLLALAGTIVPPILFLLELMGESTMKSIMLVAALAWFAAAPWWLKES